MAVFNVTAFEAEAEVLGKLRKVAFQNGSLCVNALTMEEAKLVLSRVSSGLQVEAFDGQGVTAYGYQSQEPSPETAAQVEKSAPEVDRLVKEGRKNAATAEDEDVPADLEQDDKGPSKVLVKAVKTEEKAPKSAKGKEKSASASKKSQEVAPADDQADVADTAGGMLAKVAAFTKLMDVVSVMREEGGYADDDALVAACEEMKDQVPALKRITDVSTRVRRVLERLDG